MPIIFHFANRKNRDACISNDCSFDRYSESIKGINPIHKKELYSFLKNYFIRDKDLNNDESSLIMLKNKVILKDEFAYNKNIQVFY